MATIETGIRKPGEKGRGTKIGKIIEYGVTTPSSDFDHRAGNEVDSAGYVGDSKMETRPSGTDAGKSQKKKHVSSGKGQ